MKLLTIVVPCYNSAAYVHTCIESLLPGGEQVEILIVNDGSRDNTKEIAESYADQYPSMIRVINQENGGHGSAINTGLYHAKGLYFKVVDSDDWLDPDAYQKILQAIKEQLIGTEAVDLFISNYVYEKEGVKQKKVMGFHGILPENQVFTWDAIGRFRRGHYMLMHSVIFRTKLLKECGLELPKHTFYVDNLFVYLPLKRVRTMFYLNVDFYRYFIGRADQSVNESIMIGRIDQQIKVNQLMVQGIQLEEIEEDALRNYLFHYLEIVTTVTNVLLMKAGTKEHLAKKKELWAFIKKTDLYTYRLLRYHIIGQALNLPGKLGRSFCLWMYKITQRIVGFN